MKQVWKCDFCHHTDKEDGEVERHEDGCRFNPKNRSCTTCDNRLLAEYYDMSDECNIHDFGHFLECEDGDVKCVDWTNVKERKLKLKKIIGNVK